MSIFSDQSELGVNHVKISKEIPVIELVLGVRRNE